jgi:hypothetical protein
MYDGPYPVRCPGREALATLPEHIDGMNAGQIRKETLSVINRGAATHGRGDESGAGYGCG